MYLKSIENNAENILMSLNTISSQNSRKEKRKHTADPKYFQENKKKIPRTPISD